MSFNLPHGIQAALRRPRMAGRAVAWLAVVPIGACVLLCAAQNGANPCKSIHDSVLSTPPDANEKPETRQQQQPAQQGDDAASQARKKQIADDTAKLLKLATELKTEVDKTSKDTLSLGVIRKADEIERLARRVKEKMKVDAGGS